MCWFKQLLLESVACGTCGSQYVVSNFSNKYFFTYLCVCTCDSQVHVAPGYL